MQTEIEVALMNSKLTVQESRALLESNLEEVGRLSTLSERLLSLARLDEHKLPLVRTSAVTVIEQALDAVQARAGVRMIDLKTKMHAVSDTAIQADSASLAEAIVILLDNAIKYSPEKATIHIDVSVRHKQLFVAIKDKGIGISGTDLPRIFERFYRADLSRTKNAQHGHGLGLALAHKIVALHEGRIEVKSALGKGSTFTLIVPVL
jgi:two-component system phosphate regulon sensor histidine kinase PhoR